MAETTSRSAGPGLKSSATPGVPEGPPSGSVLSAIDDHLRRVVEHPSVPRQFWHIAQLVVVGARRVQIPRMAAALSYRTLFGLIPVLVVGIIFIAAFSSEQAVTDKVKEIMKFAGLNQIAISEPADEGAFFDRATPGVEKATLAPVGEPPMMSPAPQDHPTAKLDEWIQALVTRVRTLPPGSLGVIGVITLIYAGISMLVEIEKTFNQIYMAPTGRSWTRRVVQYWAMLTLGTFGLVASLSVQTYMANWITEPKNLQILSIFQTAVVRIGVNIVPIPITTLLLVVLYTTVPNTRVRFGAALTGALLAAVLWQASKYGFEQYIRLSLGYSKLYGPIAILPLFLLWVYVTWIIILSGLQVAHALQTYTTAKTVGLTRSVLETLGVVTEQAEKRRSLIMDPAAILVVMVEVAKRFAVGKPSDHNTVADKTGMDERIVSEMLERLGTSGLVHRVAGGELEGAYTLARPPTAIMAADVLRVGENLMAVDRERAPALFGELMAARMSSIDGKSLADLMGSAEATMPGSGSVEVRTGRLATLPR